MKLSDLYSDEELTDASEYLHNYIDEDDLTRDFLVHEMTPAQAKTYVTPRDDMAVFDAFKRFATRDQKRLVKKKAANYDQDRVIVVFNKTVLDGNHHLVAGIVANRPIKFINLADTQHEETLTETVRPQTRRLADEVLRRAGYQRLGHGHFGAVYRRPGSSYVLKVFSAKDKAYLDFIALAQNHSDNPHFPKFFGKVVPVTPAYSAVRMEPLTPYRHDPVTIDDYLRLRDYHGEPSSYLMLRREDSIEFMEFYPRLREACDLIIDHLLTKYERDIRRDNIMRRGETLVMIDPVKYFDHTDEPENLPYVSPPDDSSMTKPGWLPSDEELLKNLLGGGDDSVNVKETASHVRKLSRHDISRIIQSAKKYGLSGFGGDCGEAAIAINHVLFKDKGKIVGVFNKAFYDHERYIGHFAVDVKGVFWDADGNPKTFDEIESWGMLDSDDSEYADAAEELGVVWNEETAGETVAWAFHNDEEVLKHSNRGKLDQFVAALRKALVEYRK